MPDSKRKERADHLLVGQGLSSDQEKAKAMIMAGQVFEGIKRIEKAGEMLDRDSVLTVKGQRPPYVSRGGFKLAKALSYFSLSLTDRVILDIGASTGGFTDCALQNGASRVYAVDVGYGLLDWKLRQDPRVIVMDKTNARHLSAKDFNECMDFVSIDVSFISLTKILPVLPGLMKEQGNGIALIKPQFEAGRADVGPKGVVKDPRVHIAILEDILGFLADVSLYANGLTYSPIKGPEGNIEYLLWFRALSGSTITPPYPSVVEEAFADLSES
ncbi:MAG: TlyA family RNA methyltransferase [Clostridiales bacterium]|nr:TlyA family RNA methyltransferase [Clostridiales bacterium]